jgi:methionyl aminopeptidase
MVHIKTQREIEHLREGGRRLASIMNQVAAAVLPGVTTLELDTLARELILKGGDIPALLRYKPEGHSAPYPATICASADDEIVHGIPNNEKLQSGSIISLDCVIQHAGLFTDYAITVPVGDITETTSQLLRVTQRSLEVGVGAALAGNTTGDIGFAIESFVNGCYGIVRELAGHGVGREIHEDPYIPNYGKPGHGTKLVPGMVLAIEPMLVEGEPDIEVLEDDYTIVTQDASWSAHFEHTVLITENGPEILTRL